MANKKTVLEAVVDATGAKSGAEAVVAAFNRMRKHASMFGNQMDRMMRSLPAKFASAFNSAWNKTKEFFSKAISKAKAFGLALANGIKKGLGTIGLIAGPAAAILTLKGIIEKGLEYQRFATTMSVITGSAEKAGKSLEWLMEMTNRVGIIFESAAGPFAKFAAASAEIFDIKEINSIFEAFAKVSAALHMNRQEVQGVFLALQQMASKGRVSMEELRLQLAERIPGAMQIAATSMKTTVKDLEDKIRAGSLSTSEFLIKFAEEIDKKFSRAAKIASASAVGAFKRLHNAIFEASRILAHSGLLDSLADAADSMSEKINASKPAIVELGKSMASLVDKFSSWVISLSKDDIKNFFLVIAEVLDTIVNTLNRISNSKMFKDFFADDISKQKDALISQRDKLQKELISQTNKISSSDGGWLSGILGEWVNGSSSRRLTKNINDTSKQLSGVNAQLQAIDKSSSNLVGRLKDIFEMPPSRRIPKLEPEKILTAAEMDDAVRSKLKNAEYMGSMTELQRLTREMSLEQEKLNRLQEAMWDGNRDLKLRLGDVDRYQATLSLIATLEEKISKERQKAVRLDSMINKINARKFRVSGSQLQSELANIETRYASMLSKMRTLSLQTGKDISAALKSADIAKALETQLSFLSQYMRDARRIKQDMDFEFKANKAGFIFPEMSDLERFDANKILNTQRIKDLQLYKERLQDIAEEYRKLGPAGTESLLAIRTEILNTDQEMQSLYGSLNEYTRDFRDSFEGSLSTMFKDVTTGAKDFGDAMKNMFKNLANDILDIFSKRFANLLVTSMFGDGGGSNNLFKSAILQLGGRLLPGAFGRTPAGSSPNTNISTTTSNPFPDLGSMNFAGLRSAKTKSGDKSAETKVIFAPSTYITVEGDAVDGVENKIKAHVETELSTFKAKLVRDVNSGGSESQAFGRRRGRR